MSNPAHIYPFTLQSLVIASYDFATDTYGATLHELEADQILEVDPQGDTDTMRDSGAVTRFLAVTTHANIKITQGGMDFDTLAIMTRAVSGQSYFEPEAGGNGLRYFGIIGTAALDGGEIVVAGCRACMLDKEPMVKFDGQANKFLVSEMAGKAASVPTSGKGRIYRIKRYASLAAWNAVKPTDGTTFGTWLKAQNGA